MSERAPQEIRERVWVEKFDHSGDTPQLVESQFMEVVRPLVQCHRCRAVLSGVEGTHCPFCGVVRPA